jgi:hypothetical protein
MFYSPNVGGTGKPAHRFVCQRCKPSHSIHIEDLFDAIEERLKGVKLTEREHEQFVIAEWIDYEQDRAQFRATKKQLERLKAKNDEELEIAEGVERNMQYGPHRAKPNEISKQKRVVKNLQQEKRKLVKKEAELVEESIERYFDLDAFLELAKNASGYWKKADPDKKRELADLLISHVVIDGNKVVQIVLTEPFETWARERKEEKNHDGGQYWT